MESHFQSDHVQLIGTAAFPREDRARADGNQCPLEGSVHSGLPWVPTASKKWRERLGLSYVNINRVLRRKLLPQRL